MTTFTIERQRGDTAEWETLGVYSLTTDGELTSTQGDTYFLKLMRFIDHDVKGPVTYDSHPTIWLKHLAVEYNGPGRRLIISEESDQS